MTPEQATQIPQGEALRLSAVAGSAGYGEPARKGNGPGREMVAGYAGETYYGRPAVKPSPFDWKVSAYIFLAGLGGAAQIIATAADLLGDARARGIVKRGRHIAPITAVIGAVLLIADLHTPQRWYNMLRIFRRTSPMSIGSYILSGFGLFSSLTALGQLLEEQGMHPWPGRLARAAQVPAALTGAGMTTYTAALLAATSTPLWAASPQLLAIRFASSAMASGAAALALSEQVDGKTAMVDTLDTVAVAATAVELAATALADREYRVKGVAGPLEEPPWRALHKFGVIGVGGVLPLALYALTRRRPNARWARIGGSLAVLAGGMMLRATVMHAGNRSANRPADYFRLTQPKMLPQQARTALEAE